MTIVTRWKTAINTEHVRQFSVRLNPHSKDPNRAFALFAEFGKDDESMLYEGAEDKCEYILSDILIKMSFPTDQPYYIET